MRASRTGNHPDPPREQPVRAALRRAPACEVAGGHAAITVRAEPRAAALARALGDPATIAEVAAAA